MTTRQRWCRDPVLKINKKSRLSGASAPTDGATVIPQGGYTAVDANRCYVPSGSRDRLENPGKIDLVPVEVQTGSYPRRGRYRADRGRLSPLVIRSADCPWVVTRRPLTIS
jgi:hypothetical protein